MRYLQAPVSIAGPSSLGESSKNDIVNNDAFFFGFLQQLTNIEGLKKQLLSLKRDKRKLQRLNKQESNKKRRLAALSKNETESESSKTNANETDNTDCENNIFYNCFNILSPIYELEPKKMHIQNRQRMHLANKQ